MYGSISKIPAGYTIEVRDLIVGTKYKIDEPDRELPKGYTRRDRDGYVRMDTEGGPVVYYTDEEDIYGRHPEDGNTITAEPISDTIADKYESPMVEVRNQEGWGLTAKKEWTDKDFMIHDPVYLAVYLDDGHGNPGDLIEGTVRILGTNDKEIYWFFPDLKIGDETYTFDKFIVREVKLTETSGQIYTDYYMLGDTVDYYYGPLVPSAGYLKVWGLEPYGDGLLLRVPDKKNPLELAKKFDQPKTYEMFAEKVHWDVIMRLSNAGDVNKAILKGHASELIQVSEALQEKKIVKIAEEIDSRFRAEKDPIRLVLITGPSSSGKTTFCKRLSVQLLACGLHPISFSTDDYFVNRVDTPLLPNGQYDFDNIKAVDCALLEDHLQRLMRGERVEVPEYNFVTGKREYNGKKLKLQNDCVLIIEGIHALNPLLTEKIPDTAKFKIFISALTSISLDDHNWIPTHDNRLLRRIIRDYNKGAYTAVETIRMWPNVCEAEEQWILPFQETADVMFNSALNIEFAVLRTHAEIILASVPKNCPEYSEAHRLLKFIHYFIPVSDKEIPPTSIMREFVGGSSFKYR